MSTILFFPVDLCFAEKSISHHAFLQNVFRKRSELLSQIFPILKFCLSLFHFFFYISSYFKIDYVFNYISLSSVLIVGQDVENILTYFVINDVINFLIQMVIFILVTLTRDRLAPCNTFDIILKHIRIHGLH